MAISSIQHNAYDGLVSSIVKDTMCDKVKRDIRRLWRQAFQDASGNLTKTNYRHEHLEKIMESLSRHCFSSHSGHALVKEDIALYLFERLAEESLACADFWLIEKSLSLHDHVTPRFQTYRLALNIFMESIGKSHEQTMRFCDLYFARLQQVVRENEESADQALVNERTLKYLYPLIFVSHATALSLATPKFPQKQWLINLIEHALQGDERSKTALLTFLKVICVNALDSISIISQSSIENQLAKKGKKLSEYVVPDVNPSEPLVILPDRLVDPFCAVIYGEIQKTDGRKKENENFRRWFSENRTMIEQRFYEQCEQIRTNYLHAVLSGGLDWFEVSLSPLKLAGVHSFRFFPEGMTPPDLKIELSIHKEVNTLCTYRGTLKNFELDFPDSLFENVHGIPTSYLQKLLTYLVVDALHFITISNEMRAQSGNGNGAYIAASGTRYRRPQRAQLRKLPVGFHSSDRAHMLASEKNWTIPPDRTFVREHEKNIGYPPRPSEVPILNYSNELFMKR